MKYEEKNLFEKYDGKDLALLGFGLEGKENLKLLLKKIEEGLFTPKSITIYDRKDVDLKNCEDIDTRFFPLLSVYTKEDYLEKAYEKDYVFKSPGISLKYFALPKEVVLQKTQSQTDCFVEHFSRRSLGVTGSKGKSTTTTLSFLLQKNAKLLGNIGIPCFSAFSLMKEQKDLRAVIEMSSHQLEFINKSPHIALLLNFYEEHLDHYKSLAHYYDSKLNIFRYQSLNDYALFFLDNKDVIAGLQKIQNEAKFLATRLGFTQEEAYFLNFQSREKKEEVFSLLDLLVYVKKEDRKVSLFLCNARGKQKVFSFEQLPFSLSGEHHALDLAMAFMGAYCFEVEEKETFLKELALSKDVVASNAKEKSLYAYAQEVFSSFHALEHRLEEVGSYQGRHFFNDSISTIPQSTILALKTLGKVDVLLLGGKDREVDYRPLKEYLLQQPIPVLIGLPDTAARIFSEEPRLKEKSQCILVKDMEEAVKKAFLYSKTGDTILLSPAASSYNVYKSFEERGKHFKECILRFSEEHSF